MISEMLRHSRVSTFPLVTAQNLIVIESQARSGGGRGGEGVRKEKAGGGVEG